MRLAEEDTDFLTDFLPLLLLDRLLRGLVDFRARRDNGDDGGDRDGVRRR